MPIGYHQTPSLSLMIWRMNGHTQTTTLIIFICAPFQAHLRTGIVYLPMHTGEVPKIGYMLLFLTWLVSRTMAPGGYLEFQDYGCEVFLSDGTKLEGINPEHPASTYIFHITSAAERAGRPLPIGRTIAEQMEKAGFVDIQQKTVTWPWGSWPKERELKEIGKWGMLGMIESAYPFALHLLTREGWTKEEVKELVDTTLSSIRKCNYYCQGWFVYGRKPET